MPAHAIRLRGPWDYEVLSTASTGRCTVPCDAREVFGSGFQACVRFTRRFHRPTGLGPHDRLWIVIETVAGGAAVSLNEKPLGQIADQAAGEFEITALVELENRLTLQIDVSTMTDVPTGPTGEVRLEVRHRLG